MLFTSLLSVSAVLLVGPGPAADDLKSGPQVGERVSGAFYPQWINGDYADKAGCPV